MTNGTSAKNLPGFRLSRMLGFGAFSEVWGAHSPDGTPLALKFLDRRTVDPEVIRGEQRVLEALREVSHPHIIGFYGVSAYGSYLVLRMERADGDLAGLHRTYREEFGTHVVRAHALELLGQVAEALDFLAGVALPGLCSAGGLQHCDVKPANILLVGEQAKLGDFGLCAAVAARTHRSGWRGTPPYAAPELYHGMPSSRADQYSLAVTYCEVCEGSGVFRAGARDGPPGPDLPVDLMKLPAREAPILARALQPRPATRWPSCKALIDALVAANAAPRTAARAAAK
jgi:serine/threonine protein kinase